MSVAVLTGVLVAAGWTAVPSPDLSGSTWRAASEVRGLPDNSAAANSVSCASAGNCSAGGYYQNASGRREAFVVSQVRGRWGKAIEVPGIGGLNTGYAAITSLSCASAGNCGAGGYYTTIRQGISFRHAFVVSQVRGRWGKAIEVPGSGALNTGTGDVIYSLSCGSAGNCSAGGSYSDARKRIGEAFVVSQVRGRWRKAITVPGTAAFNLYGALTRSVSCASAGNCSAGGYFEHVGGTQAFVLDQVNGRWGTETRVPGLAVLGTGRDSATSSVSCPSVGNCSAGGQYFVDGSHAQVFVVSEVHGRWGKAIEVPGTAALNLDGHASITSMSCRSAGNCSAGGTYGYPDQQVFVVSQLNGIWGTAIEVPGMAALNTGMFATIKSVSCGSPGNCSAVGFYNVGGLGGQRAFVVSEG